MKPDRIEKAILITLTAALVAGVTISAVRRAHHPAKVVIEKFNSEAYKDSSVDSLSSEEKIDINSADVEDFEKIRGIGGAIAERIVEYRYKNGNFASIDDIKNVKGVGVALFEKIRDKIRVE